MKSLKGTKTEKNLLAAFAGESQARNRYTYFASQAKKEGYEQIAAIFLETADNEKEHAKKFFKFLEGGDVEITAGPCLLRQEPYSAWRFYRFKRRGARLSPREKRRRQIHNIEEHHGCSPAETGQHSIP